MEKKHPLRSHKENRGVFIPPPRRGFFPPVHKTFVAPPEWAHLKWGWVRSAYEKIKIKSMAQGGKHNTNLGTHPANEKSFENSALEEIFSSVVNDPFISPPPHKTPWKKKRASNISVAAFNSFIFGGFEVWGLGFGVWGLDPHFH